MKRETLTINFKNKDDKDTFIERMDNMVSIYKKDLDILEVNNVRDKVYIMTTPTTQHVLKTYSTRCIESQPSLSDIVDMLKLTHNIEFIFSDYDRQNVEHIKMEALKSWKESCAEIEDYKISFKPRLGKRGMDIVPLAMIGMILNYVARNMNQLEQIAVCDMAFTDLVIDCRGKYNWGDNLITQIFKGNREITHPVDLDIHWRLAGLRD